MAKLGKGRAKTKCNSMALLRSLVIPLPCLETVKKKVAELAGMCWIADAMFDEGFSHKLVVWLFRFLVYYWEEA